MFWEWKASKIYNAYKVGKGTLQWLKDTHIQSYKNKGIRKSRTKFGQVKGETKRMQKQEMGVLIFSSDGFSSEIIAFIRVCVCVCVYKHADLCFKEAITYMKLLWWLSGKEPTCHYRRCGFNPWVGKIPWRRTWQPASVFLPGKSYWQRSLAGYSPEGCKQTQVKQLSMPARISGSRNDAFHHLCYAKEL